MGLLGSSLDSFKRKVQEEQEIMRAVRIIGAFFGSHHRPSKNAGTKRPWALRKKKNRRVNKAAKQARKHNRRNYRA